MIALKSPGAINGLCRYCSQPRPPGYSVTCGGSRCQQSAYEESIARARRITRRRKQR